MLNKLLATIKNLSLRSSLMDQIFKKNFFLNLLYYYAGLNLRRETAKCKNLEDYINIALSYKYSIPKRAPPILVLSALQIKSEIIEFCRTIAPIQSKVVLEIGTANGGNLYLLSQLSNPNALIMSVDLPVGQFIGGINYKTKSFYKAFASSKQKMMLLAEDSHNPKTLKKITKKLKTKRIDILFIDGDHSYEGVKMDFEMYAPLVKKNGIIAFHDIVICSEENVEVNKFWNEIKNNYEYFEFVEDWEQGNCGIGIIKYNGLNAQ